MATRHKSGFTQSVPRAIFDSFKSGSDAGVASVIKASTNFVISLVLSLSCQRRSL